MRLGVVETMEVVGELVLRHSWMDSCLDTVSRLGGCRSISCCTNETKVTRGCERKQW
jgi:hypothetical protein